MTHDEDKKFIIAWSAIDEFTANAYKQKLRWKRTNDSWDLYCFFTAMQCIFENVCVLSALTKNDKELGEILSGYKKGYEKLELRDFRNGGLHRKRFVSLIRPF